MNHESSQNSGLLSTILLGMTAVLLVICIIYAPSQAFEASSQGLALWWRIVFPALLPFLVLSQILMATGYAHGLGSFIDPVTRRLLGLPGTLGWVLPLGMTAGFPAAAEAAAALYKQGKITAYEAEKLASFSHYCSPVLIVIVVGTAYMKQPELGLFLLGIHWASGLSAAVTMNWLSFGLKRKQAGTGPDSEHTGSRSAESRWKLALRQIEEARREDGRSFGKLLGDSVGSAVQTLMATGGYMLIFAVIIQIASSWLAPLLSPSLTAKPIAALLEVHLGSYALATTGLSSPLPAALTGALLGWSGLSAYLQARAALKPTGLSGVFFLINRIIHGIYAYVLTLLLWKPIAVMMPLPFPANGSLNGTAAWVPGEGLPLMKWKVFSSVVSWQLCMLGLLIMLVLFAAFLWSKHFRTKRTS
ncbi:nucleoside recognition domain-containing protein [Paenibacillus woosongensis]|uniref:Nucleoside recognition domain-containing protein n=1 Tax=Paenibacillus woosongensis TaxID=307580 RepID=A0AA95IDB2_9BACL|nr:nucleoside recognition domain-containing protein [Paenibacillus woosongensis]WHX51047.1 nucleoside recognition domain-containing protein [Paenibacillus woosongensis]